MKSLLAAAVLLLATLQANAATRHDVSVMTCAEVHALLAEQGFAILSYPSKGIFGLSVYDRYVRDQHFCSNGAVAQGAGVPTTDKKYCPVRKCAMSDVFVYE